MENVLNVKSLSATLLTTVWLATQPVLSQSPLIFNSAPSYDYGVRIMNDITKSEVSEKPCNYEIIKSEKKRALSFFEEQRKFTEEESISYNNMLERLSIETGVNVLELL